MLKWVVLKIFLIDFIQIVICDSPVYQFTVCQICRISDKFKTMNEQNLDLHYCMSFIYQWGIMMKILKLQLDKT